MIAQHTHPPSAILVKPKQQPAPPGPASDSGKASSSSTAIDQRHLALLLEAQRIGRIGNWERDLRSNQLWWSDECYRLLGYEPGSVDPSYAFFLQHVHADDRARVAQTMVSGHAHGEPYDVEYRAALPSGEIRHFLIHGRTYTDERGMPLRASGTTQDITERKRIEQELRLQHAYLKAILDNMPQGISVFDENLKLRMWNKGFLEVLGLPEEAVSEGVDFADLIRIPARRGEYGPGDPEEYVQHIRELALRFEPHCFERARLNGRAHLTQGQPLTIDGRVAGFITTYTDITERRAAEDKLRSQYEQLQTLVDNMPSGVTLFNGKHELVVHNAEFRHLLDLPDELFAGEPPSYESLAHFNAVRGEYGPGDPEGLVRDMLERSKRPVRHHFQRIRPNGTALDVRGAPLSDGGFVTIYTDITDRKRSEERQQLADMVFAHNPTGIVIADDQQRILSINPAFTTITGLEPPEVIGHPVDSLPCAANSSDLDNLRENVAQRGIWSGELESCRKNGEPFTAGIRVSRVDDPQSGRPTHFIWLFSDVTERKRAEERVRHMAQHDPLTGLPNRLALLVRINQVLPEARRHGWKVAVMFLDLDRFKIINDTLGHQTGDELLREVACRLAATVRETDTVARIGGDEFVILLPDIATGWTFGSTT